LAGASRGAPEKLWTERNSPRLTIVATILHCYGSCCRLSDERSAYIVDIHSTYRALPEATRTKKCEVRIVRCKRFSAAQAVIINNRHFRRKLCSVQCRGVEIKASYSDPLCPLDVETSNSMAFTGLIREQLDCNAHILSEERTRNITSPREFGRTRVPRQPK
jgi:hypothetical protein